MGVILIFFIWIIEIVSPKFSLVEVEDKTERVSAEVFRLNGSSSGDYSSGRECGGVGMRCTIHHSDKIISNTCKFRSPSGVSYNVNKDLNKDGLTCECQNQEKQCSVILGNIRDGDIGLWSCELKALRPDGSVFHTTRQVQISEKHCPRPATPPPPTPPPPTPPPQPPAPVKRCPAAPGLVCMEKANYPGDPGRYRKRVDGVRSRGQCRNICNRDPHCCHWVHYGPDRVTRAGPKPNICWLKKEKSIFVQRNPRQTDNGPIYAGSLNCN